MVGNAMASGTEYSFRSPPTNFVTLFDDTDLQLQTVGKQVEYQVAHSKNNQDLCRSSTKPLGCMDLPQSVLLGSVLEHLCHIYESDEKKATLLFKSMCQKLERLMFLSPVAYLDDYASARVQYSACLYHLLHSSLDVESHMPLPGLNNPDSPPESPVKNILNKDLFSSFISKYNSDFVEISKLGQGAYGKVYKVQNKLDRQEYAVKKIPLNKLLCSGHYDIEKIKREVEMFSSLHHKNILRYHYSWIEHEAPTLVKSQSAGESTVQEGEDSIVADLSATGGWSRNGNSFLPTEHSLADELGSGEPVGKFWVAGDSSEEETSNDPTSNDDYRHRSDSTTSNDDVQVILTHGVKREKEMRKVKSFIISKPPVLHQMSRVGSNRQLRRNKVVHCSNSCSNVKSLAVKKHDNGTVDSLAKSPFLHLFQRNLVLYIQMQLCESTLKHWLKSRNNDLFALCNSSMPVDKVDKTVSKDVFKQLLLAMEYLHQKKMIHRDVKPCNIFLSGSRPQALLGDFGLSRQIAVSEQLANQEPLTPIPDRVLNGFYDNTHTSGVGTAVYAAPEQLQGQHYSCEADMYSTGIVLYELMWPLQTIHERAEHINSLRKHHIPLAFARAWPEVTEVLKSLLSHDPGQRMTAKDVLNSDLFHAQSKSCSKCCRLNREVVVLNDEIKHLRHKLEKYKQRLESNEISVDSDTE